MLFCSVKSFSFSSWFFSIFIVTPNFLSSAYFLPMHTYWIETLIKIGSKTDFGGAGYSFPGQTLLFQHNHLFSFKLLLICLIVDVSVHCAQMNTIIASSFSGVNTSSECVVHAKPFYCKSAFYVLKCLLILAFFRTSPICSESFHGSPLLFTVFWASSSLVMLFSLNLLNVLLKSA